jgi:hypothetical protein
VSEKGTMVDVVGGFIATGFGEGCHDGSETKGG